VVFAASTLGEWPKMAMISDTTLLARCGDTHWFRSPPQPWGVARVVAAVARTEAKRVNFILLLGVVKDGCVKDCGGVEGDSR